MSSLLGLAVQTDKWLWTSFQSTPENDRSYEWLWTPFQSTPENDLSYNISHVVLDEKIWRFISFVGRTTQRTELWHGSTNWFIPLFSKKNLQLNSWFHSFLIVLECTVLMADNSHRIDRQRPQIGMNPNVVAYSQQGQIRICASMGQKMPLEKVLAHWKSHTFRFFSRTSVFVLISTFLVTTLRFKKNPSPPPLSYRDPMTYSEKRNRFRKQVVLKKDLTCKLCCYSLLNLKCSFFILKSQSLISLSSAHLQSSIGKRPTRLRLEIKIEWH